MNIRQPNIIKADAARAMARGREPKKLVLVYSGISTAIAAVLTVVNFWLGRQMEGATGLSNLGTRTMLTTLQTLLPMVQMAALLCLDMGYLHGILRIARGQYADHTDLKVGLDRFWAKARMLMLQVLLYVGIAVAVFNVSYYIFMMTPWAEPLLALLEPVVASGNLELDEVLVNQAAELMSPMLVIFAVAYVMVLIPLSFRLRMADYALLDAPRAGAMAAFRESWKMTKGNCLGLLKLDVSLWWFFLLDVLVVAVSYGDMLLLLLGVKLPFSGDVSYFLFYGLYLAAQFALTVFLRNRVECTYATAYDQIREKKEENSVVLGNIFDM